MSDVIATTAEVYESSAMPRRIEVSCEGDDCDPPLPLQGQLTDKPVDQKSAAEWAYERLILYIQTFEQQLDNEHEVAMGFAGSDAGVLRIEGMGFFDPDIITFHGMDSGGARTQLVQHVSQLSVILRALPKATPRTAPRRIGFRLAAALDSA